MTSSGAICFSILHTNDLHSLFEGLGPDGCLRLATGSGDPVKGHYARLATLIKTLRAEREARGETVFLVDAGDAEFGSLFHLLGPRPDHPEMPEYRFFHDLGYDLLGIGNHFFESGHAGRANAWRKVEAQGLRVPFLISNAILPSATDGPDAGSPPAAKAASTLDDEIDGADGEPPGAFVARRFRAGLLTDRTTGFHRLAVREIATPAGPSLRIGWLGLLGPYGAKVSLANRPDLRFVGYDDETGKERPADLHALARRLVDELRQVHRAEVVVAIFHGGHPEDQALARAVPGLDVVIAGHTHATYAETVGRTVIAQAGYGSAWLGCLDFAWEGGRLTWLHQATALRPVTSALTADPAVAAQIDDYKWAIDRLLARPRPPVAAGGRSDTPAAIAASRATDAAASTFQPVARAAMSGGPRDRAQAGPPLGAQAEDGADAQVGTQAGGWPNPKGDAQAHPSAGAAPGSTPGGTSGGSPGDAAGPPIGDEAASDLEEPAFTYATPVFRLERDLPRRRFPDNAAGRFVASALLAEINRRLAPPVDVFFSSYGLVRSEFLCVNGQPTTFQYSDIFKFFPLGLSPDFRVGTPIHTFFLTRSDLRSLLEGMAAVGMVFPVFEPVTSDSLTFGIAWWGVPFYNKIRDLRLHGEPFVADERLVHVATDEYFARHLRRIKTLSMGLARAVPRDAAGRELERFPPSPLPPEHDLLACHLRRLFPDPSRPTVEGQKPPECSQAP
ncbi:MAG: 5'-nucleotidase [Candidatus Ozemobacter sibiricus]|uniref:5'-nucleotidase n=1 Tax=Candidatus Ozemobacter sibiricus TaxID=2268124 RepID=A0A367ZKC1_9BACT|nr:MAG: 5'-nucleotidase [Candidatus Ozemobacter sibiricus]